MASNYSNDFENFGGLLPGESMGLFASLFALLSNFFFSFFFFCSQAKVLAPEFDEYVS